ncbi:MAG TPA: transposase [Lacunisphaera sp.]|jgi:putative transposase|nr:transposase [Lacunisphaera sp.]HQY05618.1 transposase [Lacunisphaera sp.]
MARPLRLETEDGVYHILNRGNYRTDIFRSDKAKAAFLKCLDEACAKTGWQVHAWCLMSNHYHLAITTPQANLVEGMRWLQGTFATRFNRLRQERGHLFQGRYKSLVVDPDDGLGPLCHYIHLNPVRAQLCAVAGLPAQRWTSLGWLMEPKHRTAWYDPRPALAHAGNLLDTPAGRRKYLEYLGWLAEDEPARKQQRFAEMSKGWVLGGGEFTKALVRENRQLTGHGWKLAAEMQEVRESVWQEELAALLRKLRRRPEDLTSTGKSVDWKLAIAAALKTRTTVTNRWLATTLHMGNLHEVSRKVGAWSRQSDPALRKKLR